MFRKKWLSKFVLLFAAALISWAAFVSWKELERHARIRQEVGALEEEAARIRKENETLSERIGYFSSQEFREQEAKKKLGLKKPDETVVALKEERAAEGEVADTGARQAQEVIQEKTIYRKWWDTFFSRN